MTYLLAYAIPSLAIGIAGQFIGPPCPWLSWFDRVLLTIIYALLWPFVAVVVVVMLVC